MRRAGLLGGLKRQQVRQDKMAHVEQNVPFAIALKLGSVTMFVVMASLIKAGSAEVPGGEAVFFRSFFALLVIVGWLVAKGDFPGGIATTDKFGHAARGIIGTFAMLCMFTALGMLPLPEVTAIGYAKPLMVVIFAALMLGERVRIYRLGAVGLGLLGVLVILWPRLSSLGSGATDGQVIGALLVLTGASSAALAQVYIRRMVGTESVSAIVFWFSLTSSVLSALTLPFGWIVPSPLVAFYLISAGVIGGIAQIMLTMAYRYAEAAIIAPFDYASMLVAVAIGFFIFAEVPGQPVVIGAALVIGAGLIIILRERQLGLERRKQRQAASHKGL